MKQDYISIPKTIFFEAVMFWYSIKFRFERWEAPGEGGVSPDPYSPVQKKTVFGYFGEKGGGAVVSPDPYLPLGQKTRKLQQN